MAKRKNPRDSTARNVAELRKEVRLLKKVVENEGRYNEKKFGELDRAIYELANQLRRFKAKPQRRPRR